MTQVLNLTGADALSTQERAAHFQSLQDMFHRRLNEQRDLDWCRHEEKTEVARKQFEDHLAMRDTELKALFQTEIAGLHQHIAALEEQITGFCQQVDDVELKLS